MKKSVFSADKQPHVQDSMRLPISLSCLRNTDLDSWAKNYSWPVKHERHVALWEAIRNLFFELSRKSCDSHQQVMLASWKVPVAVFQYVNMLMVDRAARQRGGQPYYEPGSKYCELLDLEFQAEVPVPKVQLHAATVASYGCDATVRRRIRRYQGLATLWLCRQVNGENISLVTDGAKCSIVRQYCRQVGISPWYVPMVSLFRINQCKIQPALEGLFITISEGLVGVAIDFCGALNNAQTAFLQDFIFRNLRAYYRAVEATREHLLKFGVDSKWKIMAPKLTSPAQKVIAVAFRGCGAHVVGFSHGDLFVYTLRNEKIVNDVPLSDTYVTESWSVAENNAKSLSVLRKRLPVGKMRIVVAAQSLDAYIAFNSGLVKSVQPIREIMIVGAPYTPHLHQYHPTSYGLKWLHHELQLIGMLKERGLRVVYKAHPGTLNVCRSFIESRVDEFLVAPFEAIYQDAQCILNVSFGSSTLGTALLSTIPHILVETPGEMWDKHAKELILSRSYFVRVQIDEKNLTIVDRNDMQKALDALCDPESALAKAKQGRSKIITYCKNRGTDFVEY